MYMVYCSGKPDDILICLFENKDIWHWINHYEIDPPEEVIQKYLTHEYYKNDYETREEIVKMLEGSSGSWNNDRALSIWETNGVVGFVSLSSFAEYVRDNNIDIIGEWAGYIY
jgi:hypothetical protein